MDGKPVDPVDKLEVERFGQQAGAWWDPRGPFRPLHEITPLRLAYIREQAVRHLGLKDGAKPLSDLKAADIGCGGGLVSEPLARLGADVTSVDPAQENIVAAQAHARAQGLTIAYQTGTSYDLAGEGRVFDIVVAFEVIEHVPEPNRFLASCAALLRPGGLLLLSTLNRTAKSYVLAIIGAEYILRWLPKGTHRWDRFVTPEEMDAGLHQCGMTRLDHRGMALNPLSGRWRLSTDTDVNYFTAAMKPDR